MKDNDGGRDRPKRALKWRSRKEYVCHACKRELPFCWNCPCGFQICDDCLKENLWGMSNTATWVCPDCGRVRGF
jgi:hypothetical protein